MDNTVTQATLDTARRQNKKKKKQIPQKYTQKTKKMSNTDPPNPCG